MAKHFPDNPSHPERICWGCDRYCPARSLACGNGADRTMHPVEVFGEDWNAPNDWGLGAVEVARTTDRQGEWGDLIAGKPAHRFLLTPDSVGASLLAMVVNVDAHCLDELVALEIFASTPQAGTRSYNAPHSLRATPGFAALVKALSATPDPSPPARQLLGQDAEPG